jgi:hypothetical protein
VVERRQKGQKKRPVNEAKKKARKDGTMAEKAKQGEVIVIDNPSNLPLMNVDEFHTFQGDFKQEIEPAKLDKLMRSILDHHVFVAKAVFFEDNIAYTEDGHQTLMALKKLREHGYTKSSIVSYEMREGRMQPAGTAEHDEILVPYQVIVPVGASSEERRKDAAKKLLQLNSQYAKINPTTTLLDTLSFSVDEMDDILARIAIPNFGIELYSRREPGPTEEFEEEAAQHTNENCLFPIVAKFSEKYDAVFIVSDNAIDTAHLEEILKIGQAQTYKELVDHGKGMVINARRFFELWNSR